MIRNKKNARGSKGFTIVEFMVATTVFGVVLLAVSAAILSIGRSYQRSLYVSATQAAASNLVDTISQAIKFSSDQITVQSIGSYPNTTHSVCVGNRQFLYVLGRQMGSTDPATGTVNAAITRPNENCALVSIITATPPATAQGSPKELLGGGMRLADLAVEDPEGDGIFTVMARVIYGDDDLLCSPSVPDSCEPDSTIILNDNQLRSNTDLQCRPGVGSQYCAVSELSNSIYRRL